MMVASAVPAREAHWFPLDARTVLVNALTVHLGELHGLDPDRLSLSDVITELGVASARSQLDQVPVAMIRAAAGVPASSCQIRLSESELSALLRTPNLPMKVAEALRRRQSSPTCASPSHPPEHA